MVLCFDTKDKQLTKQHFAFVLRNETLVKLRNNIRFFHNGSKLKANRPMNVVMIALESASRLSFIRHMNFTESYLRNELDAVELLGYNKAALNTFPNVLMMLLGITWGEMNDPMEYYDGYPFIWKDFMKNGYVSLTGRDSYNFSVFHHLSKGFKWKPFDYYMRTYILGLETTNYRDSLCSGNDLVFQSLLDQLTEFVTVYNDVPHFTFTFISNPSHDDPNGLGIVDLPLRRTLTDLNTRGSLDNTVLLIFSDHGS
ncbi:hypothetical protein KP79_PYT17807 [Mizuhopecten yessoensis]|uniref:Uncharacterized protein n=1 Tax=Mizuhopecten yessoensis TaxID=6573 RepID=A0A210PJ20_MIZYE|nr:hypothetical protein KP79_PYT17807 [Mizuhopecten yessoensis]